MSKLVCNHDISLCSLSTWFSQLRFNHAEQVSELWLPSSNYSLPKIWGSVYSKILRLHRLLQHFSWTPLVKNRSNTGSRSEGFEFSLPFINHLYSGPRRKLWMEPKRRSNFASNWECWRNGLEIVSKWLHNALKGTKLVLEKSKPGMLPLTWIFLMGLSSDAALCWREYMFYVLFSRSHCRLDSPRVMEYQKNRYVKEGRITQRKRLHPRLIR